MAYEALSFIYDDIPSEKYGIFICNDDNEDSTDVTGEIEYITDKTDNSDTFHILGKVYKKEFTLKLQFFSPEEIDRNTVSLIHSWLVGQPTYKQLRIIQSDMSNVYYDCVMTNMEMTTFANSPFSFECEVLCSTPYGIGDAQVHQYSIGDSTKSIILRNTSHTTDLTYPIITFTTNKANANVNIKNITNGNYETIMTELSDNETIVLDCKNRKISSSILQKRLKNFNFHWMELLQGVNKLEISGDIDNIEIKYNPIRRMG